MTGNRILSVLAHRLAILAYVVFALFPLYWTVESLGHAQQAALFRRHQDLAVADEASAFRPS
jgi:hypothetical protein